MKQMGWLRRLATAMITLGLVFFCAGILGMDAQAASGWNYINDFYVNSHWFDGQKRFTSFGKEGALEWYPDTNALYMDGYERTLDSDRYAFYVNGGTYRGADTMEIHLSHDSEITFANVSTMLLYHIKDVTISGNGTLTINVTNEDAEDVMTLDGNLIIKDNATLIINTESDTGILTRNWDHSQIIVKDNASLKVRARNYGIFMKCANVKYKNGLVIQDNGSVEVTATATKGRAICVTDSPKNKYGVQVSGNGRLVAWNTAGNGKALAFSNDWARLELVVDSTSKYMRTGNSKMDNRTSYYNTTTRIKRDDRVYNKALNAYPYVEVGSQENVAPKVTVDLSRVTEPYYRPTSVTVELRQNGTALLDAHTFDTGTGQETSYTYTWPRTILSNPDIYLHINAIEPEDKDYHYDILGDLKSGYTVIVSGGKGEDADVRAAWELDDGASDPEYIEVQLLKDGAAVGEPQRLTADNDWRVLLHELDKSGSVNYTLQAKVPADYMAEVSGDVNSGYIVTVSGGAAERDTLVSITAPADIVLAHGVSWQDIKSSLPTAVQIKTTKGTTNTASIAFTIDESAYDPQKEDQQVLEISGKVALPIGVKNPKGVNLHPSVKVTVLAANAGAVAMPVASPAAGVYSTAQSVTLTSATAGATIYYTTNGSEPSKTSGTEYTGAIRLTGTKEQAQTTTIKAIAVKDGAQSEVASYTYVIAIPRDPDIEISEVSITVNAPAAGSSLAGTGDCQTVGVATTAPTITWTDAEGNVVTEASYNQAYKATMRLKAQEGYAFTNSVDVYVNGAKATRLLDGEGILTVSYTFDATKKDPMLSYDLPQDLQIAHGTSWNDILGHLESIDKVHITTEGGTENWASIKFYPQYAYPEYDVDKTEKQTIRIPGWIMCPEGVDPNGQNLYPSIYIVVLGADEVAAPYSPQESGTYDADLSVELVSTEKDATVYYILDDADPVEYTDPIELTGTAGHSSEYTLEAYAVKNDKESAQVTYTYTIRLAKRAKAIKAATAVTETIVADECRHEYEWETYKAATATDDGEMRYRCKYCGDVQYTVPVTAYYTFNKETQEKVLQAAQGATVKVQTPWFISFHEMVYKALQERPDVTLVVDYKNEDALYEMTIPAGSGDQLQSLFGDSQFAGFLYLGGAYATTELPRDTVFDGMSATEMWFGTTNAH